MKRKCFLVFAAISLTVVFSDILWASGKESKTNISPKSAGHSNRAAENKAKEALEALRAAYTQGSQDHFFRGVHEQPYFSYNDLKSNVTSHLTKQGQMDLLFFTDRVLSEKDKVAIKTHWQKRFVDNATGSVAKNEGHAEFIFVVNESAQLVDIRGDNPF